MKSKEIGKYALLAFGAMALIYVWFAIAGVTDLGNWTHGLRNILTGVIFVFLAQLVTGRSLNHPSGGRELLFFTSGWLLYPILK